MTIVETYLEQLTQRLILCLFRTELEEETTAQAPVFTSSPKSVEVREGQKAHFEARIIPVSDPSLKVEWFLNGQPIKQGNLVLFCKLIIYENYVMHAL